MSTNRTKTDWAYRQAKQIHFAVLRASNTPEQQKVIRGVAAKLRAAYRRGRLSAERDSFREAEARS